MAGTPLAWRVELEKGDIRVRHPETQGTFRAKPSISGFSWQVVIEYGYDKVQYIGGFESEQAAREWIQHQSQSWLAKLTVGL
jgi:hypothetical protein